MIQGGCPNGTGMGGPGYTIPGEFAQNGFANDLKHTEGVLSMARSMFPDSAGSQFFIMHKTSPHLDGDYAAFGKIIEGMDVINKIAEAYKVPIIFFSFGDFTSKTGIETRLEALIDMIEMRKKNDYWY